MDLIGKVFDNRYEIIEKIGVGGMAVVYKAKCRLLNRYVAVKVLKQEYAADELFVDKFRTEAQASAGLAHTNIVSIYDVGKANDYYYIVMEYIDGTTLIDYINKKGKLSSEEASVIGIQILKALEKAHSKEIVHCDIKPHNIMMTKDGVVKVCDFGIARAASMATTTISTKNMGSVHYLSPEQARGGYVSIKSDIYSLGVVLYQMVTGVLPFTGESPISVALGHIQKELVPPVVHNEKIAPALNDIIVKAMEKSEVDRFDTATHMLDELYSKMNVVLPKADITETNELPEIDESKISELNYETDEYEQVANIRKQKRKNRTAVWMAVFVSVIIIGAMGILTFNLVPTLIPEPAYYVVEDYTGLDYNYVKNVLENNDNVEIIVETSFVYSDTVQEGIIISQSVNKDIVFKEGIPNKIKLVVSNGPKLIQLPDYKNTQARIAEMDLKSLGFKVEVEEKNSSVPAGYVIKTDPDAGISLKPDDKVVVYKSLGPKFVKVEVPDLIGLTISQVRQVLEENNLKIGNIRPTGQTSLVAKVIEQSPQAGELINENSEVHLEFEEEKEDDDTSGDTTKNIFYKYEFTPDDLDEYDDSIKVLLEVTPSNTGKVFTMFNKKVKKKDFPLEFEIPVPVDGNTEVLILINNEYYKKLIFHYKDDKDTEGKTEETNNESVDMLR